MKDRLPQKVAEQDVASYIVKADGEPVYNSLLSQTEYAYVQRQLNKRSLRNAKLSRKDAKSPLYSSVIIDDYGQAFALYKGKSYAQSVAEIMVDHGKQPVSEEMKEHVNVLKKRADFNEVKLLGKGGFSRVKVAQAIETGRWYAVKIVPMSPERHPAPERENLVKKEVGFLRQFGRFKAEMQREDPLRKRYLFQELITGEQLNKTAWALSDGSEGVPDATLHQLIQAMITEVQKVHDQGVLHRDIKAQNFLYNPESEAVTLIDFGLSTRAPGLRVSDVALMGSPIYLPKELRSAESGPYLYDASTDIYALGQVIGMLCFGERFFKGAEAFSDREFAQLGYRRSDFPRTIDPLDTANRPLALRCLAAYEAAKQGRTLSGNPTSEQAKLWILLGGMIHENYQFRPTLKSVQSRWSQLRPLAVSEKFQPRPRISG